MMLHGDDVKQTWTDQENSVRRVQTMFFVFFSVFFLLFKYFGSNCFSRGVSAIFLCVPIATCDFPGCRSGTQGVPLTFFFFWGGGGGGW